MFRHDSVAVGAIVVAGIASMRFGGPISAARQEIGASAKRDAS